MSPPAASGLTSLGRGHCIGAVEEINVRIIFIHSRTANPFSLQDGLGWEGVSAVKATF